MSSPPNKQCRDCELWRSSKNVCITGENLGPNRVMVIGEAPGEAEAKTGRPFMGKSGQLLRSELEKAGIRDYYISNVVKCRPPDNRDPTPAEIKACRKYLDYEFETVKPEFVLTVGKPASKAVLKKAAITQEHGRIIQFPAFQGMPAYHPAYCLRDPSKLPDLQRDLERFGRLTRGEERKTQFRWKLVTSDTLTEFCKQFEAASEFAFDLETSGLFPYDGKGQVRCMGIAFEKGTWILPLEGVDPPHSRPDDPVFLKGRHRAQRMILKLLVQMSKGKEVIGHNAKFDNHWLRQYYGVGFPLTFDTMLAHHILDENSDHDLKGLVRSYLDEPDYDLTTAEKKGQTRCDKLFEYCAKDVHYTFRLKKIFHRTLKKNASLRRLFFRLVMPAVRTLEDIEMEGITLDMEGMVRVERETRAAHKQALEDLNGMIPGGPINWNSPPQIAKLLFDQLGLTPTVLTGKGNPSTGEEALLDLKDAHPVATQLVKYRELEKFLSTYIEGWKSYMVEDRLFMSYKVHGTVTGRFSSRLHQIPRDGRIRNLATAPQGWTFFQADISQAEVRTVANLSADPELVRCFKGDIDIHWRTLTHSIQSGGSGEYVKPAIETASMYCLSHGLPADGASTAVLSAVWESNPERKKSEEILQSCYKDWENSSPGSGVRRSSTGGKESLLEGGNIFGLGTTEADRLEFLQSLYRYQTALDSSQERRPKRQSEIQFSDAMSLLSSISPSVAQELWKGWKEARKKAKGTVFGYIFGMFPKKFIEYAKMKYGFEPTMKEAELARSSFFSLYRGLEPWHNRQKSLVRLDGFVRSLTGRIRRLPGAYSTDRGIRSEAERQAINSPVQGFIGDYKAMAMIELHERFDPNEAKLVGEHHDALLGVIRKDCIDKWAPTILSVIRKPKLLETFHVELTVPMEADLELGPWGAGKPWVEKRPKKKRKVR